MNNEDEEDYGSLCTFAATGTKTHFQPIFLCHTCNTKKSNHNDKLNHEDSMPLCVCSNCAEICHEGHEVEYIGEGQAYCDCSTFVKDVENHCSSCKLIERSTQIAKKLNLCNENEDNNLGIHIPIRKRKKTQFPFVCDVYDVPSLRPSDVFIEQAQELIIHTRDTHWVSCRRNDVAENNFVELCDLEKLAYSIFHRHLIAYDLENFIENSTHDYGAEWWVQVKKTSDEAIDLHYDKDEELASAFDLGSFPTLSTVTYLTEGTFGKNSEGLSISAPPTLIFAHTHEMVDEGPMGQSVHDDGGTQDNENHSERTPQLVISYSREGKHLCFDGRLLHGASSEIQLRESREEISDSFDAAFSKKNGLRITFLVNIWLSRRPSGISCLQNEIRSKLKTHSRSSGGNKPFSSLSLNFEMLEKESINCYIQNSSDRISLPFVSSDATWIDEEDFKSNNKSNSVSGVVVSLLVPQKQDIRFDTIMAYYNEGFEPCLEHLGNVDDYSEDEDGAHFNEDDKI